MFKKVLVADDLVSINEGVFHTLEGLGIAYVKQATYCDEAYLHVKRGAMDNHPYELLITDLSFVADYRKQQFTSGDELAAIVKKEHPTMKVIVYTVEDRFQRVRHLYNEVGIDAFVCKGRDGLTDLTEAIETVYGGDRYVSPKVAMALSHRTNLEIDEYDITLMRLLSYGYSYEEISRALKEKNASPTSVSAIEKKLTRLKIQFKASNAVHLVALVKDLGLI